MLRVTIKKIAAIEVNKVEMGTRTQKISSVMGQGAFGLVKEVHGECSRNVYQTPHDSQESDKMKNKQKKTNKKTEGRGEKRNSNRKERRARRGRKKEPNEDQKKIKGTDHQ